jgi:hypothetical protein
MAGQTLTKAQILAEAYRRGLLPPDRAAAYEKAATGGIVNDPYAAAHARGDNIAVNYANRAISTALPFLPEINAGARAALVTGAQALTGQKADFGANWRDIRAGDQGTQDRFHQDHPVLADNATALGTIAPFAVGAAGSLARVAPRIVAEAPAAVRSGIRAFVARRAPVAARNAMAGGATAAVYGAAKPGTVQEREANAARAVPGGAAFGIMVPAGIGAVAKTGQATWDALKPLTESPGAPLAGTGDAAVHALTGRTAPDGVRDELIHSIQQATGVDPSSIRGDVNRLIADHRVKAEELFQKAYNFPPHSSRELDTLLQDPRIMSAWDRASMEMEDEGRDPETPIYGENANARSGAGSKRIAPWVIGPQIAKLPQNDNHDYPGRELPNLEALGRTYKILDSDLEQRWNPDGNRFELGADDVQLIHSLAALKSVLTDPTQPFGRSFAQALDNGGDFASMLETHRLGQRMISDATQDPDIFKEWYNSLGPTKKEFVQAAAANSVFSSALDGGLDSYDLNNYPMYDKLNTVFPRAIVGSILNKLAQTRGYGSDASQLYDNVVPFSTTSWSPSALNSTNAMTASPGLNSPELSGLTSNAISQQNPGLLDWLHVFPSAASGAAAALGQSRRQDQPSP